MKKTPRVNEPILLEDCDEPLVSDSPDGIVRSSRRLNQLVAHARTKTERGRAIYQLNNCEKIDAGGILLLMYSGFQLMQMGWRVSVAGKGEAMDLLVRHIEHYLRARGQRDDCDRNKGDYLLREIPSRDAMVEELSEWAKSVQQETKASPEDVAIWKFQISEVTTNGFQHGIGDLANPGPMLVAGKSVFDSKTVQLAALDLGRSIPVTIAKEAKKADIPDDHGKRIRFACRKGITAKTLPVNQGAGLYKLVETVKNNGGKLLIVSGNGLLHVSKGKCYSRNLSSPNATGVVLAGTLTVANLQVH